MYAGDGVQLVFPAAAGQTKKKRSFITKVVFSDFFRDRPLVKIIKSTDFVILLNAWKDEVKVIPTADWDQIGADVAIRVRDLRPRGREVGWELSDHPRSLTTVVADYDLVTPDMYQVNGGLVIDSTIVFDFKLQPLDEDGRDTGKRRRMSLFVEEEGEEQEEEEEEVKGAEAPPAKSLMSLPPEVLCMILRYIDPKEAVYNVASVSDDMFSLIKRLYNWPNLHLGYITGNHTFALTICESARFLCRSLSFDHPGRDRRYFQGAMTQFRWENLRRLDIFGYGARGSVYSCHLLHATAKGNLPALRILTLESGCRSLDPQRWSVDRLTVPLLEELGVELYSNNRLQIPQRGMWFFDGFPRLRVLHVQVLESNNPIADTVLARELRNGFGRGSLRNLKELHLVANRAPDQFDNDGSACSFQPPFVHKGLEALTLGVSDPGIEATYHGSWVFGHFPNLKTIVVGKFVDFGWNSVPDRALAQIERLKVSLTQGNLAVVPFERMTNLIEAWVTIPGDADETSVPGLLVLKNLRNQLNGGLKETWTIQIRPGLLYFSAGLSMMDECPFCRSYFLFM